MLLAACAPHVALAVEPSAPPAARSAVPAAAVGAGAPVWVASQPESVWLNALVDVGSLRTVPGTPPEIEVAMDWPVSPGETADLARREGVQIPAGSRALYLERILCTPTHAVSYALDLRMVAPDGAQVRAKTWDAPTARAEALAFDQRFSPSSYGSDPRSLACWAAAHACAGAPVEWPPPADAIGPPGNARFVPTCTFPR